MSEGTPTHEFAHPAAVVSGANRGLGLELCRQLLARGWCVVGVCRRSSPELNALAAAPLAVPADASTVLAARSSGASASSSGGGGRHDSSSSSSSGGQVQGSLRVIEGVDATSDACVALLRERLAGVRIGLVIAVAGVLGTDSLAGFDAAAIRHQFEVNALGPLRLVHALRPALVPAAAKVALISSKMGSLAATRECGSAGSAGYRISKAAANMGGQLLALELAPQRIPVLMLHPGAVTTDMFHQYWAAVGEGGQPPPAHGAISVQDSAAAVLARIHELAPETSGRLLDAATGAELPW